MHAKTILSQGEGPGSWEREAFNFGRGAAAESPVLNLRCYPEGHSLEALFLRLGQRRGGARGLLGKGPLKHSLAARKRRFLKGDNSTGVCGLLYTWCVFAGDVRAA